MTTSLVRGAPATGIPEEDDVEVAAAVRRLFDAGDDGGERDEAVARVTTALIRRFVAADVVSTGVSAGALDAAATDVEIPAGPGDVVRYFTDIGESLVEHSTHTASPLCLSHMTTPTPRFMLQLARLVTALNQNMVRADASKAATPWERRTLATLHRIVYGCDRAFYARHVQDRRDALGMMLSGGTLANVAALWYARSAALPPDGAFRGVEAEGLARGLEHHGYRRAVVVGPASMHYSFDKAVSLLGLGSANLIRVPTDARDRMDVAAARRVVEECGRERTLVLALVGVAGTTDSGAIDPLDELADLADAARVHLHVDAAWGGPLLFSRRHRERLRGIERAASVTMDGHKQLHTPLGSGVLLVRDPRGLGRIEQRAPYILRERSRDLGRHSLEGSRPASALFVHAALHTLGLAGLAFLVEEGIRQARYAARSIQARPELELLAVPETNIVLYRWVPPALRERQRDGGLMPHDHVEIDRANEAIHRAQRNAGRTLVSRTTSTGTRYGGTTPVVALRAVFANPLTTERHIDIVLDDQLAIATSLQG